MWGSGQVWGEELPLPTFVIPAKAGTQCGVSRRTLWVPAFAGMTKLGEGRASAIDRNQPYAKKGPWNGPFSCFRFLASAYRLSTGTNGRCVGPV